MEETEQEQHIQVVNFDFESFKENLLKELLDKEKREVHPFEDLISNHRLILSKYRKLQEKLSMVDKEMSYSRIGRSSTINYQSISSLSSKEIDQLNNKLFDLEKENSELMKENKVANSKLLEVISENMRIKEQLSTISQSNKLKGEKVDILEAKVNNLDDENYKLKADINILKVNNSRLENSNIELSTKLKDKISENNNLINEILTMKNDYALKMNEMLDMFEEAKKKKEAADLYYGEKMQDYISTSKLTDINSNKDDFKIMVEETKIPNKIKCKLPAHRKNITGISFNTFGSNFLSCSADHFIKNWDCTKSKN